MGWLWGGKTEPAGAGASPPAAREVDETTQAIASLFAPKHAVLTNATSPSAGLPDSTRSSPRPVSAATIADGQRYKHDDVPSCAPRDEAGGRSGHGAPDSEERRGWWPLSLALWKGAADAASSAGRPSPSSQPPAASVSSDADAVRRTLEALPPCPLAGYTLDAKQGLIDTLVDPPHPLTAREVRDVIVQLSGLEQSAKYTVDTTFASQVGGRSLRAMELLVSPCLFILGIYLTTFKTAQLFAGAMPRQSIVLQHLSGIARSVSRSAAAAWMGGGWAMSVEQQEKLAQRHRRLLQATNARVAMTFLTGVFVLGVALVTRPSLDVVENNPEVNLGRQLVGYQQHAEASLKWLWFVYYHHPAYSEVATSLLAPPLYR